MSRAKTFLLLAALPFLGGCWPLAPIAGIIAAAGGGGGGGGGGSGRSLSGTIITDATVLGSSEKLDREPNDTLGHAYPVGEVAASASRRISGSTGVRDTVHVLVDGGGGAGVSVLRQELLVDDGSRFVITGGGVPSHVARRGNELFFVRAAAGGRTIVDVTPLVSGLVKRRFDLALPLVPMGAAHALDALLVLDNSGSSTRVVAFDGDDGRPLVIADLGSSGLEQLAAAEELATGATRMFTCDAASGELFEVVVETNGSDRRIGGLLERGSPAGLVGGIAALGYDGVLVHVVDGAGTLVSLEPDSLETVSTRKLVDVSTGERALALVAHFELGLDGFHVEVPAGSTLPIHLATRGDDAGARFFLAAIDRSSVVASELPAPPRLERTEDTNARASIELVAGANAPRGFDLVVGALSSSGNYVLGLGRAYRAPGETDAVARSAEALALASWLDANELSQLDAGRIAQLYRDPLLPDFDPGRILIGRNETASTFALPPAPTGLAFERVSSNPAGFDVVSVSGAPALAPAAARSLHGQHALRSERREQARTILVALDGIAGTPGMAWREPRYLAHSLAAPNDPGFAANQQWHYDLLNLQNAWDTTVGSFTTVMSVVDTGVRTDNTDLNANVGADGYDFCTNNTGDGDGHDPDPFDNGTFFSNGHHGSHCGGSMGARGNNNSQGTGICWNATLMMVRALGTDGAGFTDDIADSIRYSARLSNASGTLPTQRAAVINLSLGLSSPSTPIHNAIINAVNAGCVVMAAAGNDGNGNAVLFPAAHPESIAVAAADPAAGISTYSNTGPEIDITCSGGANDGNPANDIWSTVWLSGTGQIQPLAGTSMACAHASGVAGLMATVSPGLNQQDAFDTLTSTAIDIEAPGFDDFSGFGLVDAAAAVNGAVPLLDLSAANVDFGNTGMNLVVQALNAGGGSLTVGTLTLTSTDTPTGVPPTTAWLAASTLTDGKTIHLDASRTGLAAGAYQIQVDVPTNGGNDFFIVDLQAGTPASNVGDVLIRIVDSTTLAVVRSDTTRFANGYAWSTGNLASGSYFVRCGVDLDDDGNIGELGEPFGTYPAVGAERALELDELMSLQIDLLLE